MQKLLVALLSSLLLLASAQDSGSDSQVVDGIYFPKNCPNSEQLVQNLLDQFNADWKKGNAKQVSLKYYDEHIAFINEADNSVTYGRTNVSTIVAQFMQIMPTLTEYYREILATSGCEYLVKNGYFTDGVNNNKQYKCVMVFKKQPNGSYKVFRDNIRYP